MKRNRFSRREFLQTTAGAAGATLAATSVFLDSEPLFASPQAVAASDRVRFGIVGVGMEGSGLLSPGHLSNRPKPLFDGPNWDFTTLQKVHDAVARAVRDAADVSGVSRPEMATATV